MTLTQGRNAFEFAAPTPTHAFILFPKLPWLSRTGLPDPGATRPSSSSSTRARPPSSTDTLDPDISNYHTSPYRLLEKCSAHASPTVAPPIPKKKRKRADARSLQVLNEVYNRTAFPSTEEREALAKELDLLPRQVQIWFQSKRASRRKRPEEAYKAEPSVASTRELERVQELETRLAEVLGEREGGLLSGSPPFEERAPSSTSGISPTSSRGTPKHHPSRAQTHSSQSVHSTLSSWKKLMTRLATAINHVEELVCTASAEHQPSLRAQVGELRDIFTRHQNRYDEFVKLSKEYVEQYLHDLSDEIRSQSAWLDLLERRLELAKTLRSAAVDLGASFEKGVCKELRGVRAAVRACPLDQEVALFDELDELIGVIKACYVELDKFWTDEVRHVTQILKERRIQQGEGQYWRGLGSTLDGAVNGQSVSSSRSTSDFPSPNG
ncbi:hypothetical protein FA95DRAFT_1682712 [Auriscalpium vulgare]|uniref:Uncharacterized protein n=1 Tax=Auriscalpium vulgare TaxID=40419 RepID=A0ACB8RE76_9AGAM|nr:hypothetical protein FA95DRAFT_1682712 [Auriscalpium vulgare]